MGIAGRRAVGYARARSAAACRRGQGADLGHFDLGEHVFARRDTWYAEALTRNS